ncbi:MAG: hypothetical protein HQK84_03480 [Nitrospinae bacterium]|nr:hypothetical protein [Nitrospinota bacterium]
MKKGVLLITHGSNFLGMGHLVRTVQLNDSLISRGYKTFIFCNNQPETKLFFKERSNLYFYSVRSNFSLINNFLPELSLVIFDCNNTTNEEISFFKQNNCKVIVIDDLAAHTQNADLVIDANRNKRQPFANELFGEKYIFLNPEIRKYLKKKTPSQPVRNIVIVIGGFDYKKFSLSLIKHFMNNFFKSDFEHLRIKVKLPHKVSGLEDSFFDEILSHQKVNFIRRNRSVLLHKKGKELIIQFCSIIENLPSKIKRSDLLISSGGLTMYEGLTIGTYTIALPQNRSERKVVKRLHQKGFLNKLYKIGEMPELKDILSIKRKDFIEFSEKNKVFDGLGCERILERIEKLLRYKE